MKTKIFVAILSLLTFFNTLAASPINYSWVNPTQYVDGSTLQSSDITQTRIEYGSCDASNNFNVKVGEVVTTGSVTSASSPPVPSGLWCSRAYTMAAGSESDASATVTVQKLDAAKPAPPSLKVANITVFQIVGTLDKIVLIPVGTVPGNTICDPNQSVNGYYGVPRANVSWFGSVRPQVVVAQCTG
jgi:hypothetical protein